MSVCCALSKNVQNDSLQIRTDFSLFRTEPVFPVAKCQTETLALMNWQSRVGSDGLKSRPLCAASSEDATGHAAGPDHSRRGHFGGARRDPQPGRRSRAGAGGSGVRSFAVRRSEQPDLVCRTKPPDRPLRRAHGLPALRAAGRPAGAGCIHSAWWVCSRNTRPTSAPRCAAWCASSTTTCEAHRSTWSSMASSRSSTTRSISPAPRRRARSVPAPWRARSTSCASYAVRTGIPAK